MRNNKAKFKFYLMSAAATLCSKLSARTSNESRSSVHWTQIRLVAFDVEIPHRWLFNGRTHRVCFTKRGLVGKVRRVGKFYPQTCIFKHFWRNRLAIPDGNFQPDQTAWFKMQKFRFPKLFAPAKQCWTQFRGVFVFKPANSRCLWKFLPHTWTILILSPVSLARPSRIFRQGFGEMSNDALNARLCWVVKMVLQGEIPFID